MVEQIKSDLTIGRISTHFRNLAVPVAIGMVFYTLYNMVGIFFAGKLSTSAQAAIGIGHLVFFFLIAFGFGLNAAMAGLVGNACGQGDTENAKEIVDRGFIFTVFISMLLVIVGFGFGPLIINLISEPGLYQSFAGRYFLFLLISLPAFLISYTCNGALQAQGDSLSMQRALTMAFFLSVLLNPLLIFGVPGIWNGFRFDGITIAAIFSQLSIMIYMVFKLKCSEIGLRISFKGLISSRSIYIKIFNQMLPQCLSFQMVIIGSLVIQFALKGFGEHALAGYNIALRIEQLLLLPILGMTHALLPIVAQNFGAQKYDRVRQALFYCWKFGVLTMILAYPIIWIFGAFLIAFFSSNLDVIDVGVGYLRIDGLILPFYAMLFAINSFLQGVTRPASIFWIGLFRQGLLTGLFIWLFISVLHFDIWGVWIGAGMSVIFGWILSIFIAYRVARREIGGL
tara:strand:+ start:1943 stop:3304 length:1362 start_codon:yes stop_codon:yes gene_type:complete